MEARTPDRLLRVDLSAGTVESEPVPERWLRRFVGGKGLGARYLYEELAAGTDPLGPENALLFALGPLSGLVPGEARYAAITKSPHTGTFLDSYGGGEFPARLAGTLGDHVAILVTGRAGRPVRLDVADGTATVEQAVDLAGRDVVGTCDEFPDAAVACVGPAGERQVTYATIATDRGDHHAGRGGAGAVMGSKNLKAVVVRGDAPEPPAELHEEYAARFSESDVGRWQAASGTLETVDFADEVGVLPTKGWQEGSFAGAEGIGIEAAREAATGRERADDDVPGGFRVGDEGTVPRGSTPISLGAGLGIDDFDAVATLGGVCDRLGVDVISGGNAVAWAIRASEEGLVDRELSFGDEDAARALIEEIATRSSELGDALADGVDAAAARYGGDDLIPTVKRMELPAYDPRGASAMALAYATSDRGACHRRARPVESEVFAAEPWSAEERARVVIAEQNARSVLWSLVVDDFVGEAFRSDLGAEWLAALGYDHWSDDEDLATVGERVWNVIRLFNLREGFSRADDSLPPALTEPLEGGPAAGNAVDADSFDRMLAAYYRQRGWTDGGVPTAGTLARLGLEPLVDDRGPSPRGGGAPAENEEVRND